MTTNHYLSQCWLIITKVWWHPSSSSEDNFTRGTSASSHWNQLGNYLCEISFKSPKCHWVNMVTRTQIVRPILIISEVLWHYLRAISQEMLLISMHDTRLKITDLRLQLHFPGANELTHWGRDEMNNISQTTFSNVFSTMKMFEFRLIFHWSLFPRVQLTIFQHWFR